MSEQDQSNSKTDSAANGDCRSVPYSASDAGPWKVEIPGVETEVVTVEWDDRGFCIVPLQGDRQFPVHQNPEGTKWTRLIPGFPQHDQGRATQPEEKR